MKPDWLQELLELYDNEGAAEWLKSPHTMLNGKTPFDAIRDGQEHEVSDIVHRLASGAYV